MALTAKCPNLLLIVLLYFFKLRHVVPLYHCHSPSRWPRHHVMFLGWSSELALVLSAPRRRLDDQFRRSPSNQCHGLSYIASAGLQATLHSGHANVNTRSMHVTFGLAPDTNTAVKGVADVTGWPIRHLHNLQMPRFSSDIFILCDACDVITLVNVSRS